MKVEITWKASGKLKYILVSNVPMCLKRKLYNQFNLPVKTCGLKTLILTQDINRFKVKNIPTSHGVCYAG